MGHRSPVWLREIGTGGAKIAFRSRRSCLPGSGVPSALQLDDFRAFIAAVWSEGRLPGSSHR